MLPDADASEERLVRQAAVLIVAARVDTSDVGGEVETVVDVVASLGVVVMVFREALVEIGELSAEPILILLELLKAQCIFQMGHTRDDTLRSRQISRPESSQTERCTERSSLHSAIGQFARAGSVDRRVS
ncbi:MAG: hypothetical protein QM606_09900 [Leucobacter sp.]